MKSRGLQRLNARMLATAFALSLGACAPMIRSAPVQFIPSPSDSGEFVLAADVAVDVAHEYPRTLPAGGRWHRVGTVPAGAVWRPVGTVFTIEGRQVHEAWLVVSERTLVGFYLAGEARYSALPAPLSLPIGDLK